MNTKRSSNAFTLVEVLVSLVIVSMLAGMVVTAVQGVTQTAREARTRSIIRAVDSVIQDLYESYKYRPLPIETPDYGTDESGTPPITYGFEVMGVEAARVRLIMTRDLLRMELPDKKLDVVTASGTQQPASAITAVANRTMQDTNGKVIRQFVADRRQQPITWLTSQKSTLYFGRYASAKSLTAPSEWTIEHEGAECMYLIMATSFVGGSPAIDSIPTNNIGDTDSDGMFEILDGWGRPLGFVRWPVGYVGDPTGVLNASVPDDFDPFRSDFGFTVAGQVAPWSIRPLIISAGDDGEFGVELSNGTVAYNTQTWPLTAMDTGSTTPIGNENKGRTGAYVFPDPFLRHPAVTPLPGQISSGISEFHADDITNFSLEASI